MSLTDLVSHIVTALIVSLTSVGAGYQLGLLTARSKASSAAFSSATNPEDARKELEEEEEEEEEDAEGIPDGDLAAVKAGFMEPCKLVLIVRTDLKLKSGNIASHQATLKCYKSLMKRNPSLVQHWERTGQAKIALKGKSEDQLEELEAIAKSLNLCARSTRALLGGISDGTLTVLAIGPAPVNLVNEVTGKLRLL